MEISVPRVRQNFLANIVAAIASFLIEAGWYSYFMQGWLNGIGHTRDWLMQTGVNPALQYGVALLASFVMATAISCVTQLTGPQTALRGARAAVLLWLGFVVTAFATEYVFEVRTWTFFGITIGFWLIAMMVMGAIVGGWRKRDDRWRLTKYDLEPDPAHFPGGDCDQIPLRPGDRWKR